MVLAVAFDEAKTNQKRNEIRGTAKTPFLGSRDNPDLPLASLNEICAGYISRTHFHTADQFQVILDGKGTIGRHHLAPYSLHFTRAYTPYGPLVASPDTSLKFFVMRTHPETGSQRLPEQQEQLNRVRNRQPWQVTRQVVFPDGADFTETMLQAVPGVKNNEGLAAYTLSMKPNAVAQGPDPSQGDGQYVVILKGSLFHDGKEYKSPALIFVWPKDGALVIRAGVQGLAAMILNFPRPAMADKSAAPSLQADSGFRKWQCQLCSFSYDEVVGMPEEGIAPGTRWEDVPESWTCPDCSASKGDFQMGEVQQ